MAKSIKERKAELEAELAKITEQEKREEQIRLSLIGYVVDQAMQGDVELGKTINGLLETTLTKKSDREKFGLSPLPSNRGRPKTAE